MIHKVWRITALSVLLGLVFIGRGEIDRKQGIVLCLLFVVFVVMQVWVLR